MVFFWEMCKKVTGKELSNLHSTIQKILFIIYMYNTTTKYKRARIHQMWMQFYFHSDMFLFFFKTTFAGVLTSYQKFHCSPMNGIGTLRG